MYADVLFVMKTYGEAIFFHYYISVTALPILTYYGHLSDLRLPGQSDRSGNKFNITVWFHLYERINNDINSIWTHKFLPWRTLA